MQRPLRSLQQEERAEEPRPLLAAAGQQKEARGRRVPENEGRQEDGYLAVLTVVVVPYPRKQQQRRRHLEGGDRDNRTEDTAHEDPGVRLRNGHARRWISRRVIGREGARERAQVLERRPASGRGEARAPVPVHVLTQRDRVDRVSDYLFRSVLSHRASRREYSDGPGKRRRQQTW